MHKAKIGEYGMPASENATAVLGMADPTNGHESACLDRQSPSQTTQLKNLSSWLRWHAAWLFAGDTCETSQHVAVGSNGGAAYMVIHETRYKNEGEIL
jgi:hypothetical protein